MTENRIDNKVVVQCCERREGKYWMMLGLVGGFFLVELIVAVISGSLALRTDAFHMATDFLALLVALGSLRMSRRGRSVDFTYGWLRMEVIGGLVNSVILMTVCFTMLLEVIEKMIDLGTADSGTEGEIGLDVSEIDLVLIVAGIGMLINLLGLAVFCGEHVGHSHGHSHNRKESLEDEENRSRSVSLEDEIVKEREDFNHMAVMLHIFGDLLGSIVVMISGMVIKWGGTGSWRYYLDPLGTVVIVIVIGVSSIRLLMRCIHVLLHRTPQGVDSEKIQRLITDLPDVISIHEFHLWSLTSHIVIATCHLEVVDDSVLDDVKQIFHRSGVHNSTVQIEFRSGGSEGSCEPVCGSECHQLRCCQMDNP